MMCTGSARMIYQHGASPNKLTVYLSLKVSSRLLLLLLLLLYMYIYICIYIYIYIYTYIHISAQEWRNRTVADHTCRKM